MTQKHPITPPPDLILGWCKGWNCTAELTALKGVAIQAARWGADQELEACCGLMDEWGLDGDDLMECRRPKPPSLKELALDALAAADGADHPVVATVLTADQHALIRKALEQLDD